MEASVADAAGSERVKATARVQPRQILAPRYGFGPRQRVNAAALACYFPAGVGPGVIFGATVLPSRGGCMRPQILVGALLAMLCGGAVTHAAPPASTPVPSEVKPRPRPEPAAPVRPEQEQKPIETGSIRLESVYFATNRANLLPASETSLNAAGEALQKYPALKLEVQGHTDTRGSAAANVRLSQARAEAVRSYLLAHFTLDAGHLRAKGYGETQPLNEERSDAELLQNRRVVIVVMNPGALPRGVEIEK
jgi:outer membrane protein OmpA-like peptidoglycan-associated protein